MEWAEIATAVLGIIAFFGGVRWRRAKNTAKELAEAVFCSVEAILDDEVTPEEAKRVVDEWREAIEKAGEWAGK